MRGEDVSASTDGDKNAGVTRKVDKDTQGDSKPE